ncbi:RNA-binding region RNP-1 domain-containing protein [Heterostelium album PN500]|uniref:Eukaryotic translation initiation factor 3 subunit G n=1 Tax=Heterostelium pallidum (strain ATCC 26659 / Pp 5 / PN500) TaxID=670386 RepID=D3BFN4_HETP5|nr:RNA-binding region RNP-1 domain-containing protein [Heterostelium album PN500]EFA79948.1 RNA-binding region RNP-1 domain-containing protein [Heterostelium album PN500]|eukprot:XP_020432068.1 RNA-binding region RNP-1 domain-containing protein [Heterostelium album PN500]
MATVAIPQKESWAEVPEEKVIEIFVKNDKGEDVKIIKTFREYQVPVKRNKRVDERRKWEKFGDCAGTNGMSNTSSGEEVFLTLSRNTVSEEEKKDVIVCRNCKRNHFTSKCPYYEAIKMTQMSMNKPEKEEKVQENKYVLPSQRGGYSPASPIEVPSLIVSNLSENANEKDLRELFGRFGMVQKVNVPKQNDGKPRGFAYVTYADLKSTEEAIKHLDGHRYDYLVLSVSIAQRRKNN